MKDKVIDAVADILVVSNVTRGQVIPSALLIQDLLADSLDFLEVAIRLEMDFNLEISDAAVDKWQTVQDIIDYMETLIPPPIELSVGEGEGRSR